MLLVILSSVALGGLLGLTLPGLDPDDLLAAAELQRALVFDDESPELQAHLAEIFMRLGRLSDAVAAIHASFKIEVTPAGLMAEAHLRQAQGDVAGAVQSLRQAVGKVDFADEPDTAEAVHLELAEAQIFGDMPF